MNDDAVPEMKRRAGIERDAGSAGFGSGKRGISERIRREQSIGAHVPAGAARVRRMIENRDAQRFVSDLA